jgi:hypothetical protein
MRAHWPRASMPTGVRVLTFLVAAAVPSVAVAQTPPAEPTPPAPSRPGAPAEEKPTKVTIDLRVTPVVSFAPARIRAVAELKLPDEKVADFYCAGIEWDWGDLTESEESNECEPYEAGVSKVPRHFSAEHTFQSGGRYRVTLRLRRNRKVIASSSTTVTVRPGVRDAIGPDPQP